MKAKVIKISTILILMMVAFSGIMTVYAEGFNKVNLNATDSNTVKEVQTGVDKISGPVIWVAQMVGYGVATIILVVLAIKYLMASPNERAEIKKSAMIWVVGAIILFAGGVILEVVQQFSKSI